MAEQQRGRRAGSANTAAVVSFFMSASEQAKQVIDFFQQAELAEAQAALAVATSLVKGRTPAEDRPARGGRRRKAAEGDNAGGNAPQGATSTASTAQGAPAATAGRVVNATQPGAQSARQGRVVGASADEDSK